MSESRIELLADVASCYYERGEDLSAIADRIGRSVSAVSRMVRDAKEAGLVEIRIRFPLNSVRELEDRLERQFKLDRAHVFKMPSSISSVPMERFGSLAASVLARDFANAPLIGVSWGTHVLATASAVTPDNVGSGLVVQCSGAVASEEPAFDGPRVAQELAVNLGRKFKMLHAPLVVGSSDVATAVRAAKGVREVIELAGRADLLLLGAGNPFHEGAGLRRAGYLTRQDVAELKRRKAVGDIMGFHLDAGGNVLDTDLNQRIIGLHPDALRKIANVVLAATGKEKAAVLKAASKAGYVNTLVTDEVTATLMLTE